MIVVIISFLIALQYKSANGNLCAPGLVENIILDSTSRLSWSSALNPNNCSIAYYVIDVFDLEQNVEYQYTTGSDILSYNLNFLDMCKSYVFEVHALTNDSVLGPSVRYSTRTPPATNIDLSVNAMQANNYERSIHVTWSLSSEIAERCITFYRLVYWVDNDKPQDVYVETKTFILNDTLPCMPYTFQVNAIVGNPDMQGPTFSLAARGYIKEPTPPSLKLLTTTTNSVNMIWELEKYTQNRCKLTFLNIFTLGITSTLSTIRIPIFDNMARSNVDITLTDLSPNTIYQTYVSVSNEGGSSQNVTVTYQTLDEIVFDYDLY